MSRSKAAPDAVRTIVLMRHGIAEESAPDGKDENRRLTPEGRRRMKEIARGLKTLHPNVEAIHTSPLIRAVETAQAVARAYGSKVKISTAGELAPGGTAKEFRKLLERTPHGVVVFIGHEPSLTAHARALLGIRDLRGEIALKKGGCIVIAIPASGGASLEALLTPRVLRRL